MLGWFQALMPKEEKFFDLFERHAAITLAAAQALRALLEGGDKVASQCEAVFQLEDDADAVAREVAQALRRTFITPLIAATYKSLIDAMDDAIDEMQTDRQGDSPFRLRRLRPACADSAIWWCESARTRRQSLPLLRLINANAGDSTPTTKRSADWRTRPTSLSPGPEGALYLHRHGR